MSTAITNILRRELIKPKNMNILCFFLDGFFEEMLTWTDHNIFGPLGTASEGHSLAANKNRITFLPQNMGNVPKDIVFDIVLYNNRFIHEEKANEISRIFHIPTICVEHFGMVEGQFKFRHKTKNLVFTSEIVRAQYDEEAPVINYGTTIFEKNENRPIDVLIYGSFDQKDIGYIKHIKSIDGIKIELHGNTPGISKPLSAKDLEARLCQTKVFLNLAVNTSIPIPLIKAMGCGCAIVSSSTPIMDKFVQPAFGKIVDNLSEINKVIRSVLKDGVWQEYGDAASLEATNNHNLDIIKEDWNKYILDVGSKVYTV